MDHGNVGYSAITRLVLCLACSDSLSNITCVKPSHEVVNLFMKNGNTLTKITQGGQWNGFPLVPGLSTSDFMNEIVNVFMKCIVLPYTGVSLVITVLAHE